VIAMLEGTVWGGACELAMVCDILIGTEKTSFAITPARLGVPYNPTGMLHVINVIGLTTAREMFFTGQPVPAPRALQVGLLNHLVPVAELEDFTLEMARRIARNSPISIGDERAVAPAGQCPANEPGDLRTNAAPAAPGL